MRLLGMYWRLGHLGLTLRSLDFSPWQVISFSPICPSMALTRIGGVERSAGK